MFEMDEHGHWIFKCALMELFICGGCKSIFGRLICDHDVVGKGCYDLLICMDDIANSDWNLNSVDSHHLLSTFVAIFF